MMRFGVILPMNNLIIDARDLLITIFTHTPEFILDLGVGFGFTYLEGLLIFQNTPIFKQFFLQISGGGKPLLHN